MYGLNKNEKGHRIHLVLVAQNFVVNEWKAKANPRIEVRCLSCNQNTT
jgi:hypothetical protein